jgi:N-acetylneuraminic acid mutarotase
VGRRIYAIGGWVRRGGEEVALSTVEVDDTVTDTWDARPADLPTGRWLAGSGVLGGRIYVLGGVTARGGERDPLALVEVFDPVTGLWAHDADLPALRLSHAVGLVSGDLYVFGGASSSSTTASHGQLVARVDVHQPSPPQQLAWAVGLGTDEGPSP